MSTWLDNMIQEPDINDILPMGNENYEFENRYGMNEFIENLFDDSVDRNKLDGHIFHDNDVAVTSSQIANKNDEMSIEQDGSGGSGSENEPIVKPKVTNNNRSRRKSVQKKEPSRRLSNKEVNRLSRQITHPKYTINEFSFCKDDEFKCNEKNKKSNEKQNKMDIQEEEDDDSIDMDDLSDGAINESTPHVNRYKNEWQKFNSTRDKLASFVGSRIHLISLSDLAAINVNSIGNMRNSNVNQIAVEQEEESHLVKIERLFVQSKKQSRISTINLPMKLISSCSKMKHHHKPNEHRNIIGIEHDKHLWGYLFFRFNKVVRNEKKIEKEMEKKKEKKGKGINGNNNDIAVFEVEICARAKLFTPCNLSTITITKDCNGIKYLNQLHINYVKSVNNRCHFNEKEIHEVGFVWHHLHGYLGGDLAQLKNVLGYPQNATNMCVICDVTQQQNRDSPSPGNRCWNTRQSFEESGSKTYARSKVSWRHADRVLGNTKVALYDFPSFLISCPGFHVYEGILARIFYAILGFANSGNIQTSDELKGMQKKMSDWISLCEEVDDLEITLRILKAESYDQSSLEYRHLEKLTSQLEQKIKLRDDEAKHIQEAQARRNSKDGKAVSELCMRLHIREDYGIKNSMRGACAKNFVANWRLFKPYLKRNRPGIPTENARKLPHVFEGMMISIEFLVNSMLTKNIKPFSDEILKKMKIAIIEFDALYKQYFKLILNSKDVRRFGFKIHYLYHCWEWCEFRRYSTAWIDDQRCEAFNLRTRLYWHIYESAGYTRVGVLKMVNSMVHATTTPRSAGGLDRIKETNNVMKEHNKNYYKKLKQNPGDPRVTSNPKTSRRGDYEKLLTE